MCYILIFCLKLISNTIQNFNELLIFEDRLKQIIELPCDRQQVNWRQQHEHQHQQLVEQLQLGWQKVVQCRHRNPNRRNQWR